MGKFYDDTRATYVEEPLTLERLSEWRLVAKRAIVASLEFADKQEAA